MDVASGAKRERGGSACTSAAASLGPTPLIALLASNSSMPSAVLGVAPISAPLVDSTCSCAPNF